MINKIMNDFEKNTGIVVAEENIIAIYDQISSDSTSSKTILDYCEKYKQTNIEWIDYEWICWFIQFVYYSKNSTGSEYADVYEKLKSYPKHYLLEINMGIYHKEMELYELATIHFNKAIDEIPTAGYPYYLLGAVKGFLGDYEEVMALSRKAMEYAKNTDDWREIKARAMHNLGVAVANLEQDYDKAIGYVESSIFMFPNNPIAENTLEALKGMKNSNSLMNGLQKMMSNFKKLNISEDDMCFPPDSSLKECLLQYSRDRLDEICNNWGIKNKSSFLKMEVVDLLCNEIPMYFRKYMNYASSCQLKELYEIAERGGRIDADMEVISINLDYLNEHGVINFNNTHHWEVQMPTELVEVCRQHKEDNLKEQYSKRNDLCFYFAKGLLEYYGTLSHEDLYKFADQTDEINVELDLFMDIVLTNIDASDQYSQHVNYIYSYEAHDISELFRLRERNKEFDYKPISFEDLINAGELGIITLNTKQKEIFDTLYKGVHFTEEDFEDVKKRLIHAVQNKIDIKTCLFGISLAYKLDEEWYQGKDLDLLKTLQRCTGVFAYKGYSENQINITPNGVLSLRKLKAGRNSPCPCGNEKKFKKCCGR